jgi:hypothetical protein
MPSGALTLFIKIDLVHSCTTSFSFQKDKTVEGKGKGNMVPVNLTEITNKMRLCSRIYYSSVS